MVGYKFKSENSKFKNEVGMLGRRMRGGLKKIVMETVLTTQWIMACHVDDVPENGGSCIKHGDEQIAIFNFTRRKEWYATQNLCPHKQQMAISRGMIGSTGENCEPKVACPFHKKTFSLLTGECIGEEEMVIKTYPVKIADGMVFIGIA